jgi:hypothetical protein
MTKLGLCFLLSVSAPCLFAQAVTGSINGRVTDASGSVVPHAKVTIVETATNTTAATETDGTGNYSMSFLKPATYDVKFAASGFKETVQQGVVLQVNQSLRLDAKMEVGQASERVDVSASATLLNYDSPEISHVVGTEQLENVPLVASNSRGRQVQLFSKLIPGVVSTSANNSNTNNFSFSGGRPVTNEWLVDGLPTTNPSDQTFTFTPSPDSVQEFKAISVPFSAEFGHTGGGVVLVTSKSGTNELHGYTYDYFRNRLLNARTFFQPINNVKYVQNDPGVSAGGPVRVPGYNGRDKTFFFGDFNVTLSSNGNSTQGLVPTSLEKSGDFSQTTAGGAITKIYNPKTSRLGPDGKTYIRDQFAGNVIPASLLDPVGKAIAGFYPAATGNYGTQNYFTAPPKIRQVWQGLARIDQNFSSNDKGFFRFGRYNPNAAVSPLIPNEANSDTAGGFQDTQIVVSETHIFGPHWVNDFRAGVVQEVNYTIAGGNPVPQLGLKGVALTSFPIVSASQYIRLGSTQSNHDRDRSYVFNESLVNQRGRQTIKMGGDYRRQMYNVSDPGKQAGSYSFGATFTALPGVANTGNSIADLLLGDPAGTSIVLQDYTTRLNINSASAFIQDDFKVNSKLTVNLGLRWEFDGPYSEANNQFSSFNPTLVNAQTGNLGEVQFAGRNGAPRHFTPNIFYNFIPRVGAAYNFARKSTVRVGYGMYRLPAIGFSGFGTGYSQYAVNTSFSSLDGGITPYYQLSAGVPAYSYNVNAQGLPNVPASLKSPTSTPDWLETRSRTPYNQEWQVSLQHEFLGWFAQADYVGNKGTKLPIAYGINQLLPSQFGPGNLQALRPYPQYSNVRVLKNDGNSIYHAIQGKLEHRWKNGFLVSASYTFSKLIDDVDAPSRAGGVGIQNIYNLAADRGVGGYDVPQRFVVNYVYELPIGKGGKYLNHIPVVNYVLGGWQFAGLTEAQKGLPLSITQANNTGGFTAVQRPNQIARASLPMSQQTLLRWFNTDAFTVAPNYTLGNAPRFPLHGPGLSTTDFSLMRNFPIRERIKLQFAAQFFDAFNHPQFNNPGTTIGSKTYGQITGTVGSARIVEFLMRVYF